MVMAILLVVCVSVRLRLGVLLSSQTYRYRASRPQAVPYHGHHGSLGGMNPSHRGAPEALANFTNKTEKSDDYCIVIV